MARHVGSEVGGALRNGFLGILGVAGIEEMVRRTVEFGDELVNTSRRLGVTVEQLQVLRELAKDNGTELGTMAKAFEKIDIARKKAFGAKGADTMAAFAALGISPAMLRGPNALTASQLFTGPMHQATANRSMEDLAPHLKEVLGKGFGELAASLQADAGEVEKKLRKLGSIMDTETALKLKMLGDEASMLGRIILTHLGPAMLKLGEWIYTHILSVGKGTASGFAYMQEGTKGMPWWQRALVEKAKTLSLPATLGLGVVNPELGGKFQNEVDKLLGFNTAAAIGASADAKKPWEALEAEYEALKARIADEAEKLRHPTPPTFESEDVINQAASQQGKLVHGKVSELQQIGGYISPMQTSLLDVNKKSERHLASIDKKLDKIGGNSAQEFGGVQH